jgi:ABC-type transport system substrate-binding protein
MIPADSNGITSRNMIKVVTKRSWSAIIRGWSLAAILALSSGAIDVLGQFSVSGGEQLLAPGVPYNISVPQRVQDIATAKTLLAAAGHPSGFTAQLITQQFPELPQYAQIVTQSAASIGVTIQLRVESSSAYYGKATFGSSDWLDATMSLVGYGHRSVPAFSSWTRRPRPERQTRPRRGELHRRDRRG